MILDESSYENTHAPHKPSLRVNAKDPRFVDVRIPFRKGAKAYWLVTTTKPLAGKDLNFRSIAWGQALPEHIQSFVRLAESIDRLARPQAGRGFIEFTIRKDFLSHCYVYHDYERMVLDGGYYYTFDLSKHEVEPAGSAQPAHVPEQKPKGGDKPQSDAEVHSP